jgi:hypothetical protein
VATVAKELYKVYARVEILAPYPARAAMKTFLNVTERR